MGCPQFGIIGKTVTFTLQVKDGNGVAADASSLPTFKVYEDETGTAIATGTMAKLADTGTTGFYSEKLTLTEANGYNNYGSYAVRISFILSSTTYIVTYNFNIRGIFLSAETITEGDGASLTELKEMCKYQGWHETTTDGLTQLRHFINHTIQVLFDLAPWPEFHRVDGSHTFDAADDTETLDETSINRIGVVIRSDRSSPLDEISLEEWLHSDTYLASSGPPTQYALRKYTSSGTTKVDMHIFPCPAAETTLYYTYQIGPNELVNDDDQTIWPSTRTYLLMDALKTRLAAKNKDVSGTILFGDDFIGKVNRAYNAARPSYMPIVQQPLPLYRAGKWSIEQINRHNAVFL